MYSRTHVKGQNSRRGLRIRRSVWMLFLCLIPFGGFAQGYFDEQSPEKQIESSAQVELSQLMELAAVSADLDEKAAIFVDLGTISSNLGEYDRALEHYQDALAIYAAIPDSLLLARVLNDMGTVYFELGEIPAARANLFEAARVQEELGDKGGIAITCNNIAAVLTVEGEYQEAITYHRRSMEIKEELNDESGVANTINNLANIYVYQGELAKAKDMYNQSLEVHRSLNDSLGTAISLNNIGTFYELTGDYPQALEYYNQALEIHEDLQNQKGIADTYSKLGNVHSAQGEFSEALNYYSISLQARNQMGDRHGIAQSLSNIGMIAVYESKDSLAMYYFRKSLAINEELGNQRGIAVTMVNMGEILARQGDSVAAMTNYQEALRIREALNDQQGIASSSGKLGALYASSGQYQKAVELFERAQLIQENLGNPRELAVSYNQIAVLYLRLGEYPEAVDFSKKGLAIAREIGARNQVRSAYQNLSLAYEQMGYTSDAFRYFKLYSTVRDSLLREVNNEKITELQAQYDLGQKNRQIDNLKKDAEIQDAQLSRQKQTKYFLVGGFALIILFLGVLYGRIRVQQRLKEKQERLQFEKQLIQIEQKALSLQMNPHFIFNSLNAIGSFIYENDKASATRYLSKFAKLMRLILEYSQVQRIPVSKELEILKHYLELEQTRHEDKFEFTLSSSPRGIDDNYLIPPMLVQPHVENAIIHGITPKGSPGHINITFSLEGNHIKCVVEDDGIGRKKSAERNLYKRINHKSMATKISQRRVDIMNKMNPDKVGFEIIDLENEAGEGIGTKVVITMPAFSAMDALPKDNLESKIA